MQGSICYIKAAGWGQSLL